ncbi:MAG: 4-hydroxythreonine-4-phosphate dehydrogenase PdxA [Pseudomonadota bacterium]
MPLSNTNRAAPVAITLGDPAGIGPEIVAQAWQQRRTEGLPIFFWMGERSLAGDCPAEDIASAAEAADVFDRALPILPQKLAAPVMPGTPDQANAPAVIAALERSAALCLKGDASAVVTAPMAKDVLYAAGFKAPGQTEFYADACGIARDDTVMLLASPLLKVVPLTIHVPLKDVPRQLSQSLIISRAKTVHTALSKDFGIKAPRLAVCGLNPHAGEQGQIGTEERDIIAPAIAQLRAEGIDAKGPYPADSLFHAEARAGYDVALAMYHDQGLVPLKALDFHAGVNVTLGLPIVRTSPDHGTAFDIAGAGQANPRSMIEAIKLAGAIAARRAAA